MQSMRQKALCHASQRKGEACVVYAMRLHLATSSSQLMSGGITMGKLSRIALSLFEACCDSPDRVATAGVVANADQTDIG